jgi:hypothetical protein
MVLHTCLFTAYLFSCFPFTYFCAWVPGGIQMPWAFIGRARFAPGVYDYGVTCNEAGPSPHRRSEADLLVMLAGSKEM